MPDHCGNGKCLRSFIPLLDSAGLLDQHTRMQIVLGHPPISITDPLWHTDSELPQHEANKLPDCTPTANLSIPEPCFGGPVWTMAINRSCNRQNGSNYPNDWAGSSFSESSLPVDRFSSLLLRVTPFHGGVEITNLTKPMKRRKRCRARMGVCVCVLV